MRSIRGCCSCACSRERVCALWCAASLQALLEVNGLDASALASGPARTQLTSALQSLLGAHVRASVLTVGAAALGPRRRLLGSGSRCAAQGQLAVRGGAGLWLSRAAVLGGSTLKALNRRGARLAARICCFAACASGYKALQNAPQVSQQCSLAWCLCRRRRRTLSAAAAPGAAAALDAPAPDADGDALLGLEPDPTPALPPDTMRALAWRASPGSATALAASPSAHAARPPTSGCVSHCL